MTVGTVAVLFCVGLLAEYDYVPLGGTVGFVTMCLYAAAAGGASILLKVYGVSSLAYRSACHVESFVLFAGLAASMYVVSPFLPVAWACYLIAVLLHGQAVGRSLVAAAFVASPPAIVALVGWSSFSVRELEMLFGGGVSALGAFMLIGSMRELQLMEAAHRRVAEDELSSTQDVLANERRLAKVRQQWLDTFRQTSACMLLFDQTGRFMEGFGEEEILDALTRDEWEDLVAGLEDEPSGQQFGYGLPGSTRALDLRLVRLPVQDSGPSQAIVVHDASDRVSLEKKNKQLHERMLLSEKLASLGFLSAGIAHEINNPLSYISGNIEMLMRSRDADSETVESLQDVQDGISRILRITNDLRTFAHGGNMDESEARTNISEVADRVRRLIEVEARQVTRVKLSGIDTDVWVRMSEHRLHQVLLNLLVNAVQAFPSYRAENLVHVSIRTEGRDAILQVSDNGSGIAREELRQIFDPFYTTKAPDKGTGLGLSISYQLVRDAGGQLLVASEMGEGTTLTVRLPLRQEDGMSVLVVDDEPRNVSLFKRILDERYRVLTANSIQEAAALLEERHFDAIVCDIRLGDGNGAKLASGVEDTSRFLFLTALPPGHHELGSIPPSSKIAYKPIGIREFESLVDAIARREPDREYA